MLGQIKLTKKAGDSTQLLKPISKKSKTKVSIDNCSPANQNNTTTCFTYDALVKIAKGWNSDHPDDKIKIPSTKNRSILWSQIDKRLNNKCNTEWCWIEQEFVKKMGTKELKGLFRPKMPKSWKKNKYEWLSTYDIHSVMKQYEEKYTDFKFIGPVPIDFDYEYSLGKCIVDELCKLNIRSLMKKNIFKIGIIYNLDSHDQPGSHWVSMYIDLKKKKIYFFDSYGHEPPYEVKVLIERLQHQGKEIGMDIEFKYNVKRHQYQYSECGVYSIYFITQLLEEKKTFSELENSKLRDEFINKHRNIYYLGD
jgi:hypothetical protein